MPTPTAPRLYRTIVPQESYQDVAAFGKRLDEQILALQKDRETEVGTSAELAERMRGRELQERASYLASLPGQFKDPGIMDVGRDSEGRPTSKGSSMMNMQQGSDEAQKAALTNVDQAKKALQKATSQRGRNLHPLSTRASSILNTLSATTTSSRSFCPTKTRRAELPTGHRSQELMLL